MECRLLLEWLNTPRQGQRPPYARNKVHHSKVRHSTMGLFNVFAKLHGKDDWSELEPWQKFLAWIEICLTPFTLFFIVVFLLELLD